MSAVGNRSQNMPRFFLLFGAIWYAKSSAATKKKKPVRTLGNHAQSAGVHEKEIRQEKEKKRKEGEKRKGSFQHTKSGFVPIQMRFPVG